jgi:phosphopantetheinyl transferase (holo-ACP synthase)
VGAPVIGNDVVDLADREARAAAQHPRFDERVFAAEELSLLEAAPERERARWALWAAKEAAYKAARQLDPEVRFHPREIVPRDGTVEIGALRVRVRVDSRGDALHAVATAAPAPPGPPRVLCGVAELLPARDEGGAARALALEAGAAALGVPREELEVAKQGRVPRLLLRGEPLGALSLSHHGRFAAFALLLPPALYVRDARFLGPVRSERPRPAAIARLEGAAAGEGPP